MAPAKTRDLTNMLWIPPNTSSDSINAVQSTLCQALKIDKSKLNLHAAKLHTFPSLDKTIISVMQSILNTAAGLTISYTGSLKSS